MRFTGIASSVLLALLIACADKGHPTHIQMSDPLLAIDYHPDSVHFSNAPERLSQDLLGLESGWIYASCFTLQDTLYVISGLRKNLDLKDHPLEPDFGAIVRIKQRNSLVIGVPDLFFNFSTTMTQDEANCLLKNGASRYLSAFGGAKKMNEVLLENHIQTENIAPLFVDKLKAEGVIVPSRP